MPERNRSPPATPRTRGGGPWHGRPHTVATLPGVVAVEYANGSLYASTAPAVLQSKAPGTVVKLG